MPHNMKAGTYSCKNQVTPPAIAETMPIIPYICLLFIEFKD
jgi:hypothetical protein